MPAIEVSAPLKKYSIRRQSNLTMQLAQNLITSKEYHIQKIEKKLGVIKEMNL